MVTCFLSSTPHCALVHSFGQLLEGLDKALPRAACYHGPTFGLLTVSVAQLKVARPGESFGPKWSSLVCHVGNKLILYPQRLWWS